MIRHVIWAGCAFALCACWHDSIWAQRGPGFGRHEGGGPGRGRGAQHGVEGRHGGGRGPRHDERHAADRHVFHFLLQNHEKIRRSVEQLPNGVRTLTESDDPEVAAKIKEHVHWMTGRIERVQPIRMRDPLFAEIFRHAKKIQMSHEETPRGVRVVETSDDPAVAQLIKAHAEVVSGFVAHGFREAMKNHNPPGEAAAEPRGPVTPKIAGHGPVVPLPNAAHQPRSGSRLLVDVTKGGRPDQVNPGLEKVAKYLNIYVGGGGEPATAKLAVVLHGDATLVALNAEAYAKEFGTESNPNLELLRKLHDADVAIYVCGQSLLSKGGQPEELVVFVETAVSALTALVNLQADGYAYLPQLQ